MLEFDTGTANLADDAAGTIVRDMITLADWRRRLYEIYATLRSNADPAQAWRIWRNRRDALIRDHAQSPLSSSERATFDGLPYFPYDPALRHLVDLDPIERDETETQSLRDDGQIRLYPFARTRGLENALGRELVVYWIAGYGGGIFLPFADATSGKETYGGGRYLLDGIKGADLGMKDGKLVADFNFAYNPSCAYSPRWSCPLAPPHNRVSGAVRAGERMR
jgi:uncharacterized protein (DUF1684 family)